MLERIVALAWLAAGPTAAGPAAQPTQPLVPRPPQAPGHAPTGAKPAPGPAKPAPGAAKPAPGVARPVSAVAKPAPAAAKPAPGVVRPLPGAARPVPKPVSSIAKVAPPGPRPAPVAPAPPPPPAPEPPPWPPPAPGTVFAGSRFVAPYVVPFPAEPAAGVAGATPISGPAAAAAAAVTRTPVDFTSYARVLGRIAACAPGEVVPARFDAHVVDSHCAALADLEDRWRQRWLSRARPFLDEIVPADLPNRVVYPFGGGDLLTALVTFPHAVEITTVSLEPAGDPRAIETLSPADLEASLAEVRSRINHIFVYGHSKTIDMGHMAHSKLPGDLTYSLLALALNDLDPVSVRFFRIEPSGAPRYLTEQDLRGGDPDAQRAMFSNMEIEYEPRGGGQRRTFRHVAANLDDKHLSTDPSVLRHLEAKGEVTAMTKAASYLLWWKEFGQIRNYLLKHMVWMISDSTGIPPDFARAAGFEQIPYGTFKGPMLPGGKGPSELFQKLWAERAQPLPIRFGYPDIDNHDHLLITRRATK